MLPLPSAFILNVDLMAGVLAVIWQYRETSRNIRVLLIKLMAGRAVLVSFWTKPRCDVK